VQTAEGGRRREGGRRKGPRSSEGAHAPLPNQELVQPLDGHNKEVPPDEVREPESGVHRAWPWG
jgi:hypothetical protein